MASPVMEGMFLKDQTNTSFQEMVTEKKTVKSGTVTKKVIKNCACHKYPCMLCKTYIQNVGFVKISRSNENLQRAYSDVNITLRMISGDSPYCRLTYLAINDSLLTVTGKSIFL